MTSLTTTRRSYEMSLAFLSILLCSIVVATPTPTSPKTEDLKADENFLCPQDCRCVPNTDKTFLEAKCSSLDGLKSEKPLNYTLPIHSIDLSYLNLTRLSHSLERLHDLTSIDLSHNELHEFGHLGRRIKKLNLKHNRITSGKLAKLPQHVKSLNLQHNDITNLPLEFTKLTQLRALELSHNQINCSCDTLEVRNWLQERHVMMEHPVKCFYPAQYKGQSWLQVKQSLVCEKEMDIGYDPEEEKENELMMGDQPFEGSGDAMQNDEEIGKDFMLIDSNNKKTTLTSSAPQIMFDDVEGSGNSSEINMDIIDSSSQGPAHLLAETTTEMPDDEGSGSGASVLIIPFNHKSPVVTGEFDVPESKEDTKENDTFKDNEPVGDDIFNRSLGIFDNDESIPSTEAVIIIKASVPSLGESNVDESVTMDPKIDPLAHANIRKAAEDSSATYFLLGVIGLLVIGLLLFVAIKRCKHNGSRNDAENPQTELVDMDKQKPGKPLHNGIPEHVPLIGEKSKSDMAKPINGSKPYGGDTKDGPNSNEPLLNGNGNGNANGNGAAHTEDPDPESQLQAPHEYYPISPRYPTPQSPRASKYSQQPQQAEPNNNDPNETYSPSSPKAGRYSPVYSPETGRVKIKLSETPKPKTPMLVTRSRSNAGDIITTPIRPTQMETIQAVPVHTAATNGHAGGDH